MAKLSAIIPSRDERFLLPTIHDLFRNARGEFEVIAVLDSDRWPEGWKEITDQYPNLHTIHNGRSLGMRASINRGVASAISRGAKFIMKSDGHCSFSEGFDEVIKADIDDDWVVVPRRGRLDPENWVATETHKPDIDYHYLSFPDNPQDWGGKGLNGKPWPERAVERASYYLDDEMSSQGSCWFMCADYFNRLELMDESSYGSFWNEFQEIGLKCWLSGGKVMVNKKTRYLHLHKGTKYGRGYKLAESQLQQGASFTKNWIWNDAWLKQTLPFSWLIQHFWPVPSWPDNWEEILYASRKPRMVPVGDLVGSIRESDSTAASGLQLHSASYGVDGADGLDVLVRLQSLVKDDSLDIVVNNSTLTPGENPFRGKKKKLTVTYSFGGLEHIVRHVEEKDWLIIGPVRDSNVPATVKGGSEGVRLTIQPPQLSADIKIHSSDVVVLDGPTDMTERLDLVPTLSTALNPARSAAALNDYLIRRFSISPQRLRGPMPIELRDFHRNDLAQLFAELGFKRGAEIGVAEGNYSEVLLKANPECELLLVDPWHHYSDNPQGKSKEKHEFAYTEMTRKVMGYQHVKVRMQYSMDAVRDVDDSSLDFVYIDGHHSYPYVMCDIIEWTKRVRSGGIVALDDIYKLDEARWGAGPMEAIYDYTRAMRINPWWLIAAHKSVDAFFVKP